MMLLSDVLSIIGVFLLGAAAGGCVKYARYRSLVALCEQLTETDPLSATDRMLMAGQFGQGVLERRSTPTSRVQAPGEFQG
jgi:hypothetical protein